MLNDADDESYIRDCTVEYGIIGVLCLDLGITNVNIEGDTFRYCKDQAIWIHNSNPTIQGNLIVLGGRYGIYTAYSSPEIYNNKIQYNSNHYAIFYNWQSAGYLRHNTIAFNKGGVRCANGSSPKLIGKNTSEPFGANKIVDNGLGGSWWGVCPSDNSSPALGVQTDENAFDAARNSIYDNTAWEIKNLTGTFIFAYRNYWGGQYPSFYPIGSVFYVPYSDEVVNVGALWKHTGSPNIISEYITKGHLYEGQGDLQVAIEAYRWVVDNHPESEYADYALARLMSCRSQQRQVTTEANYLSQLSTQYKNSALGQQALFWRPIILARLNRRTEAVETSRSLMAQKAGTEMEKDLLFQLAMMYYYEFDDWKAARQSMDEFLEKFPDDLRSEDIRNLDFLFDFTPSLQKPQAKTAALELPTDFVLYQNYPNPFNPETEICFQLPERAQVTIEIYNILGRKVKKVLNTTKTPGSFNIRWDGHDEQGLNAASEVYICRMVAVSENTRKQFVASRKLVLVR